MKDIAAAALHQIEASVASGIWEAHTTKYTNDTKISIERFRVFVCFVVKIRIGESAQAGGRKEAQKAQNKSLFLRLLHLFRL